MNQLPTNDSIGIAMDLRCDPSSFSNILLSFSKGLFSSCLPGTSTSPLSGTWWRFQRRGMRNIILAVRWGSEIFINAFNMTNKATWCMWQRQRQRHEHIKSGLHIVIFGALHAWKRWYIGWFVRQRRPWGERWQHTRLGSVFPLHLLNTFQVPYLSSIVL